jgi:hypothetical protein
MSDSPTNLHVVSVAFSPAPARRRERLDASVEDRRPRRASWNGLIDGARMFVVERDRTWEVIA